MTKVAYVTNFCTHYTKGTFEKLALKFDVNYLFFSRGEEKYWQKQHGTSTGNFKFKYLSGFSVANIRITPGLVKELFSTPYDVYLSGIDGKFALPITYLIARLRKRPFVLWTGIWMRLETRFQKLIYPFTRYIYHHADAIVTYGQHVKDYLVREEEVNPEKIFPTHHAVDNDYYSQPVSTAERNELREKYGIAESTRIILYLGRLTKIKGLPYLLEAFHKSNLVDCKLMFAGTGEEEARLKELTQELNLTDKVIFTGYIPVELARLYYALAWCLVLPSVQIPEGKETWGLVVNEAMNQGIPVIASDAVGAAAGGLIKDNENGLIVPQRDAAALERALTRIVCEDGLQEKLSLAAKLKISIWTQEQMALDFSNAILYAFGKKIQ